MAWPGLTVECRTAGGGLTLLLPSDANPYARFFVKNSFSWSKGIISTRS